ncbi:MAG: Uma2 family endonuclease [Pegethrix bostrychoides GSE-TBD4-15B]|jgi:Uma2 family endonuclease|uniref:Uma2 family endonuclease n=1 Tax=Pegethrix bostrychoides GSE-TBD4-15B TaxID=2839662 RepID=A0A951U2W5_9CYAN|nr:Uma2 family endonuclease [Pegethrix bostrychoides GSE-TBD4-15B]
MVSSISECPTLEQFLQIPNLDESPAWEYINGEAIQKPMGGGKHSRLQKRIIGALDQAGDQYEAFPELRCTFGGRSVVPDIVVVSGDQIPLDATGEISSSGIDFAPPWVIEILSPRQSQTKVTGKILHCIRHGSQLGWLIDPEERSVLLYRPDRLPDLLMGAESVTILTGIDWTISVEQIFDWLR